MVGTSGDAAVVDWAGAAETGRREAEEEEEEEKGSGLRCWMSCVRVWEWWSA